VHCCHCIKRVATTRCLLPVSLPCFTLRKASFGDVLQASDCDNICTFFAVISVGGWGKCPFVTCSPCLSLSLVRNTGIVVGTVRGSGRWAASSTDLSRAPLIRLPVPVPLPLNFEAFLFGGRCYLHLFGGRCYLHSVFGDLKHFYSGAGATFTLFLGPIGFNFGHSTGSPIILIPIQ
jgi:hypothetical protein